MKIPILMMLINCKSKVSLYLLVLFFTTGCNQGCVGTRNSDSSDVLEKVISSAKTSIPSQLISRISASAEDTLFSFLPEMLSIIESMPQDEPTRLAVSNACQEFGGECKFDITQSAVVLKLLYQHTHHEQLDLHKAFLFFSQIMKNDSRADQFASNENVYGNYKLSRALNDNLIVNQTVTIDLPIRVDSLNQRYFRIEKMATSISKNDSRNNWFKVKGMLLSKKMIIRGGNDFDPEYYEFKLAIKVDSSTCMDCRLNNILYKRGDTIRLVMANHGWHVMGPNEL